MIKKTKEKEKAVKLRRRGFSYSEILKQVPVAKSTLSLWLRSVGLSKRQKQRLTKKKLAAALRGAQAKRRYKQALIKEIKDKAKKEIKKLTRKELWLLGTVLYWAEGTKEKEYRSSRVSLGNSDPRMILLFLKWLKEICLISPSDLNYEIYIHETANWRKAKKFWVNTLAIPDEQIKIYFKRHKINSKRRNVGKNYHGLMRIRVKKSINLNRKIAGWIEGICENCGVVEW